MYIFNLNGLTVHIHEFTKSQNDLARYCIADKDRPREISTFSEPLNARAYDVGRVAASITSVPSPSIPEHHSCQFFALSSTCLDSTTNACPFFSPWKSCNLTICPFCRTPNTFGTPPMSRHLSSIQAFASGASHNCLRAGSGASRKPEGVTHLPGGSRAKSIRMQLNKREILEVMS